MTRLFAALALLCASCSSWPDPAPPPTRPATGPGSCTDACAVLDRLGCDTAGPSCVPDCDAAKAALSDVGSDLDTGCVANATTCGEAGAC